MSNDHSITPMATAAGQTTADLKPVVVGSGNLFGPLVLFSEKQPPNDYAHRCVIVFRDGYETLSDGGSVHDACVKSGIAYAWREVLPNAGREPARSCNAKQQDGQS